MVSVPASQLWDNFRVVIIASGPVDLNSRSGATNSGCFLESSISPRLAGVGPRDNGARDVCVSDSSSNSPLYAVAGCVLAGVSQSLARFIGSSDGVSRLGQPVVVGTKWSRYLTIHRRPPHRNTRPLAGHLQAETPISCPEAPGALSEPPNQPVSSTREATSRASRSPLAPTASLR